MFNAEKFVAGLSYEEKDELYRYLWLGHVKEDVQSYLDDRDDIPISNYYEVTEEASKKYVAGRYDCNLSYWENIAALVNEVVEERGISS